MQKDHIVKFQKIISAIRFQESLLTVHDVQGIQCCLLIIQENIHSALGTMYEMYDNENHRAESLGDRAFVNSVPHEKIGQLEWKAEWDKKSFQNSEIKSSGEKSPQKSTIFKLLSLGTVIILGVAAYFLVGAVEKKAYVMHE